MPERRFVRTACGGRKTFPEEKMVGVTGFEPATSSSRTTRATKLRYTPLTGEVVRPGGGNFKRKRYRVAGISGSF